MESTLSRTFRRRLAAAPSVTAAVAFETRLGFMALAFDGDLLRSLTFDHPSIDSALNALPARTAQGTLSSTQREVQQLLVAYAARVRVDLAEIEVVPHSVTPFAQRVLEICRQIPYGETLSYSELATVAGSPGAARAVGNVMASNRVPLVIPCHRVVGSHGSLGGYSARGGLAIKQRLLDMESAAQ